VGGDHGGQPSGPKIPNIGEKPVRETRGRKTRSVDGKEKGQGSRPGGEKEPAGQEIQRKTASQKRRTPPGEEKKMPSEKTGGSKPLWEITPRKHLTTAPVSPPRKKGGGKGAPETREKTGDMGEKRPPSRGRGPGGTVNVSTPGPRSSPEPRLNGGKKNGLHKRLNPP